MRGKSGFHPWPLLPPSVDEWLPEKHLARFVAEVIDGLELVGTVHAHEAPSSLSDDLTDDKLSPREIGSLLTLAIAMAITRYRYDPARRAAVARRRWNRMSKP
jgi:hypothetical protein